MNKALQEVVDKSKSIIEQRDATRAMFAKNIKTEERNREKAEADKANAADADEYEESDRRLRTAMNRLEYYRAALPKYDHMVTKSEYTGAKEVRLACAKEAAATFGKKAEKALALIEDAYNGYLAAIKEINEVADTLDEAAGVTPGMTGTPIGERAKRYNVKSMCSLYIDRPSVFVAGDPVRLAVWGVVEAMNGLDDGRIPGLGTK